MLESIIEDKQRYFSNHSKITMYLIFKIIKYILDHDWNKGTIDYDFKESDVIQKNTNNFDRIG